MAVHVIVCMLLLRYGTACPPSQMQSNANTNKQQARGNTAVRGRRPPAVHGLQSAASSSRSAK
jgi:hypothetical protein